MKAHRLRLWFLGAMILALAGFSMSGCNDDSPTTVVPSAGTVQLQFVHNVAGQPLMPGSIVHTNAAGDQYSVVRLDYLISNVELVSTEGWRVTQPGPFFVQIAVTQADTLADELEWRIPPGVYDQVAFTFGIDETINHTGEFLTKPWHSRMTWPDPLGGGYHYMIFDGFVAVPGGSPRNHNTHLGRTQTTPHYFKVGLDVPAFTVDANATTVEVHADLNQWFEDPNVYSFPDSAFIMDKPTVQDTLRANGATVFSVATP